MSMYNSSQYKHIVPLLISKQRINKIRVYKYNTGCPHKYSNVNLATLLQLLGTSNFLIPERKHIFKLVTKHLMIKTNYVWEIPPKHNWDSLTGDFSSWRICDLTPTFLKLLHSKAFQWPEIANLHINYKFNHLVQHKFTKARRLILLKFLFCGLDQNVSFW